MIIFFIFVIFVVHSCDVGVRDAIIEIVVIVVVIVSLFVIGFIGFVIIVIFVSVRLAEAGTVSKNQTLCCATSASKDVNAIDDFRWHSRTVHQLRFSCLPVVRLHAVQQRK
jgi:hypothetical protein